MRANEIIRLAEEEVAVLEREQAAVEHALSDAAGAHDVWMTAYGRLQDLARSIERRSGSVVPAPPDWPEDEATSPVTSAAQPGQDDRVVVDFEPPPVRGPGR